MSEHNVVAHTAFELVYGRAPRGHDEVQELAAVVAKESDRHAMLQALLQLRRNRVAAAESSLRRTSNSSLSQRLKTLHWLDAGAYEVAHGAILKMNDALVIGQREYLLQHKARFRELLNACTLLVSELGEPLMLEFGASEFSRLYKQFIPGLTFHLSDRPTPPGYIGFTEEIGYRRLGCDRYIVADLEQAATLPTAPGLRVGGYDLIICAEVIEHLVVNPVELLRALLALLKPDGFLYLTTPNLFRAENRERWMVMENPQEVFPEADGNWDRHHHHREYGAIELFRFAQQAGGEVAAFYYSDCWDPDDGRPEDERSNLVLVITRTHSADSVAS